MASCMNRMHRARRGRAGVSDPRRSVGMAAKFVAAKAGALCSNTIPRSLSKVGHAIVLCGETEHGCPRLSPFALQTFHCPFEAPAQAVGGPDLQPIARFRRAVREIEVRIRSWVGETAPR
jgi:hypothetical protein